MFLFIIIPVIYKKYTFLKSQAAVCKINKKGLHKQKLYIQHYKDKLLRCKTYAFKVRKDCF